MTQLEPAPKPKNIVEYIKLDEIEKSAERTLGTGGRQFLTSILSFANSNSAIMQCEPRSVYAACLTAATLDLSVNPNLGQAYILPYKNKGVMQAQFQIGYRGFIQLSIRSGEFQRIGANEVYEGQLVGFDDFSGEPIFNFNLEETDKVIGYMAYFQLTNGFRKVSYMSRAKVEKHAKEYSQAYKKNYGPWKDNFDGMAKKTVLKLLLSKFAPLSTEMQRAIEEDQKVVDEYSDNKVLFEVEGATVEGEPIDAEPVEETPMAEAEPPMGAEPPAEEQQAFDNALEKDEPITERSMTGAQRGKIFAMTGKLTKDKPKVKEIVDEAYKVMFGKKSRGDLTLGEAQRWIDYLTNLEQGEI